MHEHRQYQSVFEYCPVPLFICTIDDTGELAFLDLNASCEKAIGLCKGEVIGHRPDRIPGLSPENAATLRTHASRCLETGEPTEFEGLSAAADRNTRWLMQLSPLPKETDRTRQLIGCLTIIPEAGRRMEHRIERDVRYQEVFFNISECVFVVDVTADRRFRFSAFNPAEERLVGYSTSQIAGKFVEEVLPDDLAAQVTAHYRRCLETGNPITYDQELPLANDRRTIRTDLVPIRNSAGRIYRIVGVSRDITDHRETVKELQRSHDLLRAIIEAAPTPIIGLDLDGNVHSVWNPAAEKMLGWSAREVMGRPLPSVADKDQDEFRRFREHIRLGRQMTGVEVRRQRRDGSPIEYSIYGSPLYDANERVTGNIAVLVDITERKRAERERTANLKFLECLDRVNRAIQGARTLDDMLSDVLDIVLAVFACDRTYLLHPCDPEAKALTVAMERQRPGQSAGHALGPAMPMQPDMAQILRILLTADEPVQFGPGTDHPLPEALATRFGVNACMSIALRPKVGKPWQFGLHRGRAGRPWTPDEQRLFQEIGWRVTDGLTSRLSFRDLRQSEEFLNNIVENIPNMVFVKEAKTLRFVTFNRAGEQLLGYTEDELLWKNDYDLFPKKQADFFATKDREVLSRKKLLDIPEETIRNRNDDELILHTKKIPILDEAGEVRYLLGISEDITERKKTDEAVRKLLQAIEQSPVSIVITDVAGTIEFVNSKFTEISGYSFDEVVGRNPRILKSGETSAEEYSQLWQTIGMGRVWKGEFSNRKKNGALYREQATIAPIRNSEHAITHYVAVKEDITERTRLEERLRQAQKLHAVGQLAGGVAHDFNNMLGVIIGNLDLVLAQVDPDQPYHANLHDARTAAERSADLTRQLLAFARKQTVAPKVLDLNETVEGMLKMLRRLIGEDIDLAWLPGAKSWTVKMDPTQIDQILANLCINARDAITGVGRVTIETRTVTFDEANGTGHPEILDGDFVLLAVSDDGHGMDRAMLDMIFEPFFTTKQMGKGTGLGLATVYGIVEQNGGFIDVDSRPGQGSSFRIYFPRHETDRQQPPREEPAAIAGRGRETILLVEDEDAILQLARQILERFGYLVLTASTPGEAIDAATGYHGEISLLITDVVMPEMTGQVLANHLIALYPRLKHLFMSGYTGSYLARHGPLDEGVHFIQKPFSMQAFATKVREVLDGR